MANIPLDYAEDFLNKLVAFYRVSVFSLLILSLGCNGFESRKAGADTFHIFISQIVYQ